MISNEQYKKQISIVVPAYNCSDTIYRSLKSIIKELEKREYNFELIVVIDGEDRELYREVKRIQSDRLKVFHYEINNGKGFAVKLGMERAYGDYVGYIDAGNDITPVSLIKAIEAIIEDNVDIVCGSKKHSDSVVSNYSFMRRIYTWGYNKLVKILLGIDFKDTQVGLKMYSRRLIVDVLPRLLVKRFAFEVEMLSVARQFGYTDHIDVPVEISFAPKSTAATYTSILNMIWDTLAVFYRLKILNFYIKKSKEEMVERRQKEILNVRFI